MKALILDSNFRVTTPFDFTPSEGFVSSIPIIVSDDPEVIKKISAAFKQSQTSVLPDIILKIKELIDKDDLIPAKDMLQRYFNVSICCKPSMLAYLEKL